MTSENQEQTDDADEQDDVDKLCSQSLCNSVMTGRLALKTD